MQINKLRRAKRNKFFTNISNCSVKGRKFRLKKSHITLYYTLCLVTLTAILFIVACSLFLCWSQFLRLAIQSAMRCWGIGATPLSWLKSSTTCYATYPPCRPISVTTRFSYKNYRKRLVKTKCFMSNPSKFYGQFQVNTKYITYRSNRAHFSVFQSVLKERDVGRTLECFYCKRIDQSDDSYYVKLW